MRWLTNIYDFHFKWTAIAGIVIPPTKSWLSQLVNFKNAIWTFLSLPIFQTLLPMTFAYSLSSEAVVMRQLKEMKEAVTKVIDTLTQEDFHEAFQKFLER